MKAFIMTAIVAVGLATSTPAVPVTKEICKGDAAMFKPPVPNNPWHIRNVIWRNMRLVCLQQKSTPVNNCSELQTEAARIANKRIFCPD